MPSLRDIQRRIRSVAKTQQITSAMRMVAAAKLRRAQDAIIAARPYSTQIYETIREVGRRQRNGEHPLLAVRDPIRVIDLVVITSDRGLCGAFNASAIKHAERMRAEYAARAERVAIIPVGRKARDYFRSHHPEAVVHTWLDLGNIEIHHAVEIAEYLTERFVSGECDEVRLVANEFVSALTQVPREIPLLPLAPVSDDGPEDGAEPEPMPYKVEPSVEKVLAELLPRAIEFTVYRLLLENQAGEHAARMTAMESATRNTEELIGTLTLQFNRARQAAITKELVEIVTGAQALE